MKLYFPSTLMALVALFAMLSACTQLPTEKQGVSDMRSQLSFKVLDESLRGARIIIDGLDMGVVDDYAEGVSSLRILSGSHQLRILANGRPVVEEKLYIGDGVNRTILVK